MFVVLSKFCGHLFLVAAHLSIVGGWYFGNGPGPGILAPSHPEYAATTITITP